MSRESSDQTISKTTGFPIRGIRRDPGWGLVVLSYLILAVVGTTFFRLARQESPLHWEIGAPATWKLGMEPIPLLQGQSGFCILTEIGGGFFGRAENLGVFRDDDGRWQLNGHSGLNSMLGSAAPILTRESPIVQEHSWSTYDPPRKLIHENDGFPVLSSVNGGLRGGGEIVRLWLDSDGYWWLGGHSGVPWLESKAMTIRTGRKLKTTTVRFKDLGVPLRLVHRDQGICFLSGIAGEWSTENEHARVEIHEDGYWYFEFERGNGSALAEVTVVFLDDRHYPDWKQLATELNDFSQWTPVRGEWTGSLGVIRGSGDSELRFKRHLPKDLVLKFTLNIGEGTRPRILVNGIDHLYLGDEGNNRELFIYGRWLADPQGKPRAYKTGEPLEVEIRFFRDLAEFRINGKVFASGERSWPGTWELLLSAGDRSGPGACTFSNFQVGPVERKNFSDPTPGN